MTAITPSKPTAQMHSDAADGQVVELTSEPVELYKILKFEGLAESGGQAKALVAQGQVTVNGKVELQKRKKIVHGDVIELDGNKLIIQLSAGQSKTSTASATKQQ